MPVIPRHTPDSELSIEDRLERNRWRNVKFFTSLIFVLIGLILTALIDGRWFFIMFMFGMMNSMPFADIDREYRSGDLSKWTVLSTVTCNILFGMFFYLLLW